MSTYGNLDYCLDFPMDLENFPGNPFNIDSLAVPNNILDLILNSLLFFSLDHQPLNDVHRNFLAVSRQGNFSQLIHPDTRSSRPDDCYNISLILSLNIDSKNLKKKAYLGTKISTHQSHVFLQGNLDKFST